MSDNYMLVDSEGNTTEVEVEVTIGRGTTNDVILSDPLASRLHATVYFQESSLMIRDEESVNGTLVNNKKIYEPMRLKDQDQLQFGDEVFIVQAPITQSETVLSSEIPNADKHEAGTLLKETGEEFGKTLRVNMEESGTFEEEEPPAEENIEILADDSPKKGQRLNLAIALLVVVFLCVCCTSILLLYFFVLRDTTVFSMRDFPLESFLGFLTMI